MACTHEYEVLDAAKTRDGRKSWIFYCRKCLDLQEVAKNPDFMYDSDSE